MGGECPVVRVQCRALSVGESLVKDVLGPFGDDRVAAQVAGPPCLPGVGTGCRGKVPAHLPGAAHLDAGPRPVTETVIPLGQPVLNPC
jgi:hypothetical protein